MTTAPIHAEFHDALEAERTVRLRRRVVWYCATMVALTIPRVVFYAFMALSGIDPQGFPIGLSLVQTVAGTAYVVGLALTARWVTSVEPDRDRILLAMWRIIVIVGLVDILFTSVAPLALLPTNAEHFLVGPYASFNTLVALMLTHFAAALFVPWTPREAMRPLIPLLLAYGVLTLLFAAPSFMFRLGIVLVSPLVGVPGVAICAWRDGRFRKDFLLGKVTRLYREIGRELAVARQIQESLFPACGERGAIRVDYSFKPMHEIGGDFVFVWPRERTNDATPVTVVVMDITGHGVAAALTVNRLSGELERLVGEHGARGPAALLSALNRYFELTLQRHGIFATALALVVDEQAKTLTWANAGHPAGIVVRDNVVVLRLKSSTTMLGALDAEAFETGEMTIELSGRDHVYVCTDGLVEARRGEEMLGADGLAEIIADIAGRWRVAEVFTRMRSAGWQIDDDDALLVELACQTPSD